MGTGNFDLQKIEKNFQSCLCGVDDVLMDEYLEGYKEISKFFYLMGTVFSFVNNDVKNKIEILEAFRQNGKNEKFETFRSMIEHEIYENLLSKSNFVSGSRTLLRLHRGLDFFREFLGNLPKLMPEDKTSSVCQAAYTNTLAKFHPWIVRKGAIVAMYALPSRRDLLEKVCVDTEAAISVLPNMLETTKIVYDRTENLYTIYDLHLLK